MKVQGNACYINEQVSFMVDYADLI